MINLFWLCIEKNGFSNSPKGTYPHDWSRRKMINSIWQWKPMELGGVPRMNFPLGLLFYVCSSAKKWVSYMF